MSGLTAVGGNCRKTPPTTPVIPFCSCSSVAARTNSCAVSEIPYTQTQKPQICLLG